MNIKKISVSLLFASLCFSASTALADTINTKQLEKLERYTEPDYSINRLFENKDFVQTELIIKLSREMNSVERATFLNINKLVNLKSLGRGFYVVTFPKGVEISALAKKLSENDLVQLVEPNYKIKKEYTPKDPFYKNQWFHKMINSQEAWDSMKGSGNVVVAVVDGGVHVNHPDLRGKMYKPFDAVDGDTTLYPDDHGTHVAGIIAASLNTVGVAGVAPNVKIMPVNVFSGASTTTEELSKGIMYAADNEADIINLSLGSYYYSSVIENAIKYAQSKGKIVVAAAGNDNINKKTYPAAYNGVFGISATNRSDKAAYFSNYGSYVDFAAPGEDIYSTIAYGRYGFMSGTSMAAPVASGTIALVLSKNPFLTQTEVNNILIKSTKDLYQVGWDNATGYGRIDASEVLINTPVPLTNIALSPNTFIITGSNTVSIITKAFKDTQVTVFVKDASGKIIRTISKNKKSVGDQMKIFWNGKNDKDVYVNSGTYKIIVKAEKGTKKIAKETNLSVTNKVKPSIQLEKSYIDFSPKVTIDSIVKFKLNKYQKVSAKVYNKKGTIIRTIIYNKGYSGGPQSISWDAKDRNGKIVTDGEYKLKFESIDSSNQTGEPKTLMFKIDSKAPLLKSYATSPTTFKIGKTKSVNGKVTANELSFLTVYIVNSKNQKIRDLTKNKSLKEGTHTISWEGKLDSENFVKAGKYKFVFEGKDAAGNKKTVSSNWFYVQK